MVLIVLKRYLQAICESLDTTGLEFFKHLIQVRN